MASIIDIRNDIADGNDTYLADGMESFSLDDITYEGYKSYNFIWEKSLVRERKRTTRGNFGNMDIIPTFVVAHLIVEYDIMPIDMYRKFIKQHLEKNEFALKCYDPLTDKIVERKVAITTPPEPNYLLQPIRTADENGKIKEKVAIVGVRNYQIELSGTGNDTTTVDLTEI